MVPVFMIYDELNEVLYNNVLDIDYEEKIVTVYHEKEVLHVGLVILKNLDI